MYQIEVKMNEINDNPESVVRESDNNEYNTLTK